VIVVSDTSPIRALCCLGLLDALPALFGETLIPPGVANELRVAVPGIGALDVSLIQFLRVAAPVDQQRVAAFLSTLGVGESEAIVLAIERRADYVLMDDRPGRAAALNSGLTPLGTLGVLVRSKDARDRDRNRPAD